MTARDPASDSVGLTHQELCEESDIPARGKCY